MSPKDILIVFDLDYTLWPFWVDTNFTPPFRKKGNEVIDADGRKIKYYPEVPSLLKQLRKGGYQLGVASRTSEIQGAEQLIDLFNWNKYFNYKQIYPGCKVTHFNKLKQLSGLEYKQMIFFDDEYRNIIDINKLGATAILVEDGMSLNVLNEGLDKHKRNV